MSESLSQSKIKEIFSKQGQRINIISKELYGMCMGLCDEKIGLDDKTKLNILSAINKNDTAIKILNNLCELSKPKRTDAEFSSFFTQLVVDHPGGRASKDIPLKEHDEIYTKSQQLFESSNQFRDWFNKQYNTEVYSQGYSDAYESLIPGEFKTHVSQIENGIVISYSLVFLKGCLSHSFRARSALESDSYTKGRFRGYPSLLTNKVLLDGVLHPEREYKDLIPYNVIMPQIEE